MRTAAKDRMNVPVTKPKARQTHMLIAGNRYIVDEWIEYGDGSVWFKAHLPRTTKQVIGWL